MVARRAGAAGVGLVLWTLLSAQAGAHSAVGAVQGDVWDECGPLTAPGQRLCVGQQHVWLRFLALYSSPGYGFTGDITIHLDGLALSYAWTCPYVDGYPSDYCSEEGIFPRSGMPFTFRCTAEGSGMWGCSLNHA